MGTKKFMISSLLVTGVIFTTGCTGKFYKGAFENKVFDRFDKDKISGLSKKEYLNLVLYRFKKIDNNNDGKITKKELKKCRFSKLQKDYFKKYDLNNNKIVTKAEIIEQTKLEFIKLDKNNNGLLSKVEYKKEKIDK